jgi:hypothetical protein
MEILAQFILEIDNKNGKFFRNCSLQDVIVSHIEMWITVVEAD